MPAVLERNADHQEVDPNPQIAHDEIPNLRTFTRDEYHRLAEEGILRPDERVELIKGRIIVMPPQGEWHAWHTENAGELLGAAFGSEFYVREEKPVVAPGESEPEPDVTVASGSRKSYFGRHPTSEDLVLVVEVAESGLRVDQGMKLALYAEWGLAEYWILNRPDYRLEVYREPGGVSAGMFGYNSAQFLHRGQSVTPLAKPEAVIRIDDLLPGVEAPSPDSAPTEKRHRETDSRRESGTGPRRFSFWFDAKSDEKNPARR